MTTPRSTPSSSTATIAPRRPRPSERSSDSNGWSSRDADREVLLEHVADRQGGAPGGDLGVHAFGAHDPEEVAGGVHHREPRPAVAQEELLLGVEQPGLGGDRDRLGVHHVGYPELWMRWSTAP